MINACCNLYFCFIITVHGDIRHLEIRLRVSSFYAHVHGDIRHLEIDSERNEFCFNVHGDIRHLEIGFGGQS